MSVLSFLSPLGLINAIAKIYPAEVYRNISCGDNERQSFDLYLPINKTDKKNEKKSDDKTPVIVFFYGGSWNAGEKSSYEFVARRLTNEGYIVAVADYRLYPEVTYPDFLHDSANAVKKVTEELNKAIYRNYNPEEKIILMGHSAGAYNVAMLAMDERWLEAVGVNRDNNVLAWIGLAGPYDLYPITVENVKPVFHHPDYPEQSNPIEFAHHNRLPALLIAPEKDHLVNIEKNTMSLAEKLKENNVLSEAFFIKRSNHITLVGSFSPILFFTGSVIAPIKHFVTTITEAKRYD